MTASAGYWISLGIGISLLLMLGRELLISVQQARSLKQQQSELAESHARLCLLQNSQANELRELRSALRAEKAHVEQLQRKNRLMALLLDELQAQLERQ